MPRIHFQQSLAELKDKLLAMAALSQSSLDCALNAYTKRDLTLCHYVYENEPAINSAERDLDEMSYDLLATEQPMAIDLRFILAVIKINGDLERIGDQSLNIATRAEAMLQSDKTSLPVDIPGMGDFAVNMIRLAIQSLLDADCDLAHKILEMDDEIDEMNRRAHSSLLALMQQQPEYSMQALNAIIISRNLERVADHATNIAEDVIFWVKGSDVRHQFSAMCN